MTAVTAHRSGQGVAAVFVHGSLVSGRQHWSSQLSLGKDGYELFVLDRRGYDQSPTVEGEDFLRDAADIAQLLAEQTSGGAHLVGDSYGAIAALYAANQRPELVRSLTVLEPPAFGIVEHPACRSIMDRMRRLWEQQHLDDRAFLEAFLEAFMEVLGEGPSQMPEQIVTVLVSNVDLLRAQRPVWEADPPLAGSRPRPTFRGAGGERGGHPSSPSVRDFATRMPVFEVAG